MGAKHQGLGRATRMRLREETEKGCGHTARVSTVEEQEAREFQDGSGLVGLLPGMSSL